MKSKRRKVKTTEVEGISIREIRPDYFMVDFMRDGKRERQCFKTFPEAKTHCEIQARKISNEGSSVLDLSPVQREDAKAALDVLKAKVSLKDAALFWARHNAIEGGVTVADLGRRWLLNLKAQGCRDTTIRERTYKVERFSGADMGNKPIASLTRADIKTWMDEKAGTGATWDTWRRTLRAMLQFAVDENLLDANPAGGIKPVKMDEQVPKPLIVDAVATIMQTVEKWVPVLAPTLAVQFFGGLRPNEAMGLDWTAIDFKGKLIRVSPEISKVRRSRIIEMNQTLIDWLTPYRKLSGPIGIQTKSQFSFFMHRKPIGEPYEQEGIPIAERRDNRPKGILAATKVEWIQDGPRKTFATMHFATHGDAAKLAGILGHTGGNDVLYRHYRGLATKDEARRYWKIRPATAGAKVIPVNFKAAVS